MISNFIVLNGDNYMIIKYFKMVLLQLPSGTNKRRRSFVSVIATIKNIDLQIKAPRTLKRKVSRTRLKDTKSSILLKWTSSVQSSITRGKAKWISFHLTGLLFKFNIDL